MPERISAEAYHRVFVGHHEGALILEDLVARFYDVDCWAPGGAEGARETDRRAARREVVHFILTKLGQVGRPDPNADDPPPAP
jgi:hypothetical protein